MDKIKIRHGKYKLRGNYFLNSLVLLGIVGVIVVNHEMVFADSLSQTEVSNRQVAIEERPSSVTSEKESLQFPASDPNDVNPKENQNQLYQDLEDTPTTISASSNNMCKIAENFDTANKAVIPENTNTSSNSSLDTIDSDSSQIKHSAEPATKEDIKVEYWNELEPSIDMEKTNTKYTTPKTYRDEISVVSERKQYNVTKLAASTGQTLSDGDYQIISASQPEHEATITATSKINGANLQLSKLTNEDDNQIFTVQYLGKGLYKISQKTTGRVLNVETNKQANVQLRDSNGNKRQQWIIKETDDGNTYEIISYYNGLGLSVRKESFTNQINLQMHRRYGNSSQKFRFIAVDKDARQTIEDGDYHIVSALDTTFGLDVVGTSTRDHANVQIANNIHDDNQIFTVKYLNNGYYLITAKRSGKALDDSDDGTYNTNNVAILSVNETNSQQWIIKPSNFIGFFEIVSKNKNKVLDIAGGVAKNGANVQLYVRNGNKAQAWKFMPVKDK